ncbi:MAG: DNA polymerase III subunit delta [Desulfitobacteriia bacterium]|jgi:DNA polymerase-3 subunit delta
MSLKTVEIDIEKELIPPLYLWYGEDRYTINRALARLKEVFLTGDPSGSDIEFFSFGDTPMEKIIDTVNAYSFFSRRLVILDDLNWDSKGKEPSLEKEMDLLVNYCQNPNPASCLLIISEKINRTRKLYKTLLKNGKILEFVYPKNHREWVAWIQKEAELRNLKLTPKTASFFLEWVGHFTGILGQELDKLSIYKGDNRRIEIEEIEKICVPVVETTVFAMIDAISVGNLQEALKRLKEILSREHYLRVHKMIVRQIRLLLAAVFIRKKKGTVEELMKVAGIKSLFEGRKIYRQAAGFSPQKLGKALEDCLRTELALKSSGGNPHLLLELMVIRFCK